MNTHYLKHMEIRAEREPWRGNRISIHMALVEAHEGVRTVRLVEPLSLKELTPEDDGIQQYPCFSLSAEDAQQFMDELYRAGIRPTEGAGSVGQLGAVQAHLQDMRTLVFKPGTRATE